MTEGDGGGRHGGAHGGAHGEPHGIGMMIIMRERMGGIGGTGHRVCTSFWND